MTRRLSTIGAVVGIVIACLVGPGSASRAASCPLPVPDGPVILTITGELACGNADGEARFDRAMLEAHGMVRLQTHTHWHDDAVTFEGPLVRDVMAAVGAQGGHVEARALNDYAVEIPSADFERYDVLFALKLDGMYMRVRDKGPVWIVYPRDRHPELNSATFRDRWIWQLRSVDVRR